MSAITKIQRRVLEAVHTFWQKHGRSPTHTELQAQRHYELLIERGYLIVERYPSGKMVPHTARLSELGAQALVLPVVAVDKHTYRAKRCADLGHKLQDGGDGTLKCDLCRVSLPKIAAPPVPDRAAPGILVPRLSRDEGTKKAERLVLEAVYKFWQEHDRAPSQRELHGLTNRGSQRHYDRLIDTGYLIVDRDHHGKMVPHTARLSELRRQGAQRAKHSA